MKQKTLKKAFLILTLAISRGLAQSQGFVNLDFESPILPLVPDFNGFVPLANALPGWSGYLGTNQIGVVVYDTVSIGAAAISIHDSLSSRQPFQGSYFVLLQPNFPSGQVIPAIAQVGTVPNSAQSLRFFAFGSPSVSFASQQIPLSVLDTTSQYSVYGGNISAFAGQTGELRFQGGVFLDNIFFSPEAIPEPNALGLFGLGALLLGYRSRRKVGM